MNNYTQKTKYRIILSGNSLEIYQFQIPVFYNFSAKPVREGIDKTELEIAENRKRSLGRSHGMVRRLVQANYGQWLDQFGKPYYSKFLTLTFRENILDVKEGNQRFTLFIKRANYEIFKSKLAIIQYLSVIEFQPKSKRVHYHAVLFNLPYIDRYIDVFKKTWDQGFMRIEKIHDERGAAQYITKYITKEDDKRLRGQKSYFCSRELKRPVVMLNEILCAEINRSLNALKPTYSPEPRSNDYTGMTTYRVYDLSKNPELKNFILANQESNRLYSKQ